MSRLPQADETVTALYSQHAGSLIRLAVVIVRDRGTAEDLVQDAFCGLYQRWDHLSGPDAALPYLRSAVINRCRSVLRHRARRTGSRLAAPPAPSAETDALAGAEHRAVLAGLRQLPQRQREALALRYFAGLSERETAEAMGVSAGTVKSTTSRALAALGKLLEAEQ